MPVAKEKCFNTNEQNFTSEMKLNFLVACLNGKLGKTVNQESPEVGLRLFLPRKPAAGNGGYMAEKGSA